MTGSAAGWEWIKSHLGNIAAALATAFAGYLVGMMTVADEVERLTARIVALEASSLEKKRILGLRREHHDKVSGVVNYLCEKDDRCNRRYPPVTVPE
jgi:hypothetical protein